MLSVSTPSRICLFGEHQDYLGLDVITMAIDLRFYATVQPRHDSIVRLAIQDVAINTLNQTGEDAAYPETIIDLTQPIVYRNNRDYLYSTVNVLLKHGYPLQGVDIRMWTMIPIGKGMCSSSTMIMALLKALLESIHSPDKDDAKLVAQLGFEAEVSEFNEPGGMMDHLTSAVGGMVHLSFADGVDIEPLDSRPEGCFILFDSLDQKDTTHILAQSKIPTLEALDSLRPDGVTSVRDFYNNASLCDLLHKLDDFHRRKLTANINNYSILREALDGLENGMSAVDLGRLIYAHHINLRDGLCISTPTIDRILETAIEHGALGGKINGSGGGGCCFAYAYEKDADRIMEAVGRLGFPSRLLHMDSGMRVDATA